jgi:hypothetical protein
MNLPTKGMQPHKAVLLFDLLDFGSTYFLESAKLMLTRVLVVNQVSK